MTRVLTDLRYGVRMLLKTPGATVTVLVALSLGIGLSAITFSLITGAVLTTLPVPDGEEVVRIDRAERAPTTADDYVAWSARQRSLEAMGRVGMRIATLSIEGRATETVLAAAMTPSVLPLLAVQPAIGRAFTAEDAAPGAPAVALVSHDLWRQQLDADPSPTGRTIRVDGRVAQVVGVMPEGFGFPVDQKVWWPLDVDPVRAGADAFTPLGEGEWIIGRLRDGVSRDDAAAELTALTRQLDAERGGTAGRGSAVLVSNFTNMFGDPGAAVQLSVLMLGVALLVLLVACANAANVLLARAINRRREIAIRLAMGASRLRVATQLLSETALIALAGAMGGVGLALFGRRFIDAAIPPGMPYWIEIAMDPAVLGFVAAVAALAALAAGLMPALLATRSEANEVLKDYTRGSAGGRAGRVMGRLIAVEMALSFVLLVMAGLFIRSGANFRATEFAFEPEGVYTAIIRLPEAAYDAAAIVRLAGEIHDAVAGLPQVGAAALATAVPGIATAAVVPFQIEGADPDAAPAAQPRARWIAATPDYFELFRAPVEAGRGFDARDAEGGLPVAIVNRAFAAAHFDGDAIGRRIRRVPAQAGSGDTGRTGEWRTVIGVAPDALLPGGIEVEVPEAVYLPFAQEPRAGLMVIARPADAAGFAALPGPIRDALAGLEPDAALFNVRPLDRAIDSANSGFGWFSVVFLVAGGIALFLAAVGLYGVMAFWVIQRTREIGVRMALGSQRWDILRLVVGQGMRRVAFGLAAGIALALPAAAVLRFALFGVAPWDPLVFGSIASVLVAVAVLGCLIPARRATRMDPLEALAAE